MRRAHHSTGMFLRVRRTSDRVGWVYPLACSLLTLLAGISPSARADVYPHHSVTLSFRGPESSETDEVNPFTDYRLLVTFRHANQSMVIRGFYAADGNSAHSHATKGDVWRVCFAPPRAGDWTWAAELRRGPNVAISDDENAGTKVSLKPSDGAFDVQPFSKPSPKTRDLRKMAGRLRVDGHYYRFGDQGPFVLKVGANSPENLLAYADFDGTYRIKPNNRDGEAKATTEIHQYKPHRRDWRRGDPTWAGGKGKSLIGAVNYLASTGMNSVYFLTMNIGGDGKDVWPYATPDDFTRFDCSKLDQWEILFQHMQQQGLILHVITQETENETLLDDGDVGHMRKLYYRELIARFAHHPGLIWNLGEENGPAPFSPDGQTTEQQTAMADYLVQHDPYRHPIVIHTHASKDHQEGILIPLLGHKTLSGLSHQIGSPTHVHDWIAQWRARSDKANHPWVISMDEIGRHDVGALPDSVDPDHRELRSLVLWGSLLAGSAGVEWYFGYKHPETDLTCEDWRSRDALWKQTRIAANFFQDHLPYWKMRGADLLVTGGKSYCFATHRHCYAIYRFAGQPTANIQLDLRQAVGKYQVRWFNPRTGGELQASSVDSVTGGETVDIGLPPSGRQLDWVVLVVAREERSK